MPNYFRNFKTITYNQQVALNIAQRVVIPQTLSGNPYVYLPYTIEDGDTPELVSHFYYDDIDLVWLVYFANNIIDPTTDWLMPDPIFHKYLIKKYENLSGQTGTKVLDWMQDQTRSDNIVWHRHVDDNNIKITHESYLLDPSIIAEEWECIRYYQYEWEHNEDKRVIQLVNKVYADEFQQALKGAMNE